MGKGGESMSSSAYDYLHLASKAPATANSATEAKYVIVLFVEIGEGLVAGGDRFVQHP